MKIRQWFIKWVFFFQAMNYFCRKVTHYSEINQAKYICGPTNAVSLKEFWCNLEFELNSIILAHHASGTGLYNSNHKIKKKKNPQCISCVLMTWKDLVSRFPLSVDTSWKIKDHWSYQKVHWVLLYYFPVFFTRIFNKYYFVEVLYNPKTCAMSWESIFLILALWC